MKASYNWIQSYIEDTLPNAEEIADRLTRTTYEVESIEHTGDDVVFDIDVLPNRSSDSLGHIGIAREIALLFGSSFIAPFMNNKLDKKGVLDATGGSLSLSVDSSIVRRATKRTIRGITVGESPEWLKERLASVGQRSINNIVDVTNFVMWEIGTPVHAFDFRKISGNTISIRCAQQGEYITALDGIEYELNNSIPVIADEKGPLDIAGIKGGNHTSVDDSTKDLMLSVCSFVPSTIRTASRILNLRTDASKRFENDVPQEMVGIAMERLTSLILEVAGGVIEQTLDEWPVQRDISSLTISCFDTARILGKEYSKEDIDTFLQSIGCTLEWNKENTEAMVIPPYWRTDLTLSQQLIEEIGRLTGYNTIPQKSLTPHTPQKNDSYFDAKKMLRSALVSCGVSEIFTYSFRNTGSIETQNKIASDKGFLRNNLSDGMKESLDMNARHKDLLLHDSLSLFEIGKVATSEKEEYRLCIGVRPTKGSAQKALSSLVVSLSEKLPGLTPVLNALPLETGIIEFEIDPTLIVSDNNNHYPELISSRFSPISQYPYIVRDVAFWTPAETSDFDIESLLRDSMGTQAIKLTRFDRFEKENRVSNGYRIVFQSYQKTLTDEEVASDMERIYQNIQKRGWEIR